MAGWHAVNLVKSNSERGSTDNNERVKQGNQSIITPSNTPQFRPPDLFCNSVDVTVIRLCWMPFISCIDCLNQTCNKESEQSQLSYDFAVLVLLF